MRTSPGPDQDLTAKWTDLLPCPYTRQTPQPAAASGADAAAVDDLAQQVGLAA